MSRWLGAESKHESQSLNMPVNFNGIEILLTAWSILSGARFILGGTWFLMIFVSGLSRITVLWGRLPVFLLRTKHLCRGACHIACTSAGPGPNTPGTCPLGWHQAACRGRLSCDIVRLRPALWGHTSGAPLLWAAQQRAQGQAQGCQLKALPPSAHLHPPLHPT